MRERLEIEKGKIRGGSGRMGKKRPLGEVKSFSNNSQDFI